MFAHPKSLARAGQALLASAVALTAWMQRLEPGLDPTYAPISFYARSRHGGMLLAVLLMTAVASLAFSRAYKLLYPNNKGGRPLVWSSVAVTISAVLRARQYFPWDGPPTVEGSLHMVAAVAGMLSFAYAALLIGFELKRRILLSLGAVFLAMAAFSATRAGVLLLLGSKPQSMGLEERLMLLVAVVWFFVLFPFFGGHKTSLVSGGNPA